MSKTLPSWVIDFFDEDYQKFEHGEYENSPRVARKIQNLIGQKEGSFYDQCCGSGYVSEQFAQCGWRGVGVDQSIKSIEFALSRQLQNVEFLHKDAGAFCPFPVDLAMNWHTSLGYGGEEGARILLENLYRATKKGGHFIIDCKNAHPAQKTNGRSEKKITWDGRPAVLARENTWEGSTLYQSWQVIQNGQVVWEKAATDYFHPPADFFMSFAEEKGCGLRLMGDLDANKYQWHSPRLIAVFKK